MLMFAALAIFVFACRQTIRYEFEPLIGADAVHYIQLAPTSTVTDSCKPGVCKPGACEACDYGMYM